VIDHLVRGAAVVLKEVVVFGAGGAGEAFANGLEMNSLVSVLIRWGVGVERPSGGWERVCMGERIGEAKGETHQDLSQRVVRNIRELCAVVLRYDKLLRCSLVSVVFPGLEAREDGRSEMIEGRRGS